MAARRGFTLIELSIVLVIIGLIVGGVLVGRDLIHAAQIRSVVSQHNQFEAATNTFLGKYNCLPGDCPNTAAMGVGAAGVGVYGENGNGNGYIGIDPNGVGGEVVEPLNFWYHLSQAKLIGWSYDASFAGSGTSISACIDFASGDASSPCLALKTVSDNGRPAGWWLASSDSGDLCEHPATDYTLGAPNYWWITGSAGGDHDDAAVLLPLDAFMIDSKMDDGHPLSGIVVATGDSTIDPCGPETPYIGSGAAGTLLTCVDNDVTPNIYNVPNSSRTAQNLCGLLIRASF